MEAKERRKQITELAIELEGLDDDITGIIDMMTKMVDDKVTSDTGQIMVVFNSQENVWVRGTAPLIIQQPKEVMDPSTEEYEMIGMHYEFADPMLLKNTIAKYFPVHPKTMIRVLTLIRNELAKDQRRLDIKMGKLMETKKGQLN